MGGRPGPRRHAGRGRAGVRRYLGGRHDGAAARRAGDAAIREGSGAASRPHVAVSRSGERGSWSFSDAGLPGQGTPRLLEAAGDGRTAYLVLSPVEDGGVAGGALPGVPGSPAGAEPAGSLYATSNAGGSWELRAPAGDLPADGVTGQSVDPADPSLLYLVSGDRLLISRDGGRTLRDAGLNGVRAVETMEPREVAVAQDQGPETGLIQYSRDGGATFAARASARSLDSLGYRRGDGMLLGEGLGRLLRIDARRDGRPEPVRIPLQPRPGTALGDRGSTPSYTVLAEHSILRWVDLTPGAQAPPPPGVGDLAPPPPPPGRVEPASQDATVPVGESRLLDYRLVLPPSPTPVDLVFLVDTSPVMGRYIEDLRENLGRIASSLACSGIDVKVGLATTGPGPADGEPPYPDVKSSPVSPTIASPRSTDSCVRSGPSTGSCSRRSRVCAPTARTRAAATGRSSRDSWSRSASWSWVTASRRSSPRPLPRATRCSPVSRRASGRSSASAD